MHILTMKANHEVAQRYLRRFQVAPSKRYRIQVVACEAALIDGRVVIYFPANPEVTMPTLQEWLRKAGLLMIKYGWNEREGVRIVCEELT